MRFFRDLIEFHKERKRTSKDKFVVLIFPILAAFFSIVFNVNYITGIFLFLVFPCIYLSIRYPLYIKKNLIFALIFAIPFTVIVDYIAHATYTWYIPSSIFNPFRLFGLVPIEEFIWGVSATYLVIIFYEAFLDSHIKNSSFRPHMKYLVIGLFIFVVIFSFSLLINPTVLLIEYFYLKLGILFVLTPIVLVLMNFPLLTIKFIKTGAYFFYLAIIYEITALRLKHWIFPDIGDFIGYISIGKYAFPLEEFIFWMLLGTMALLSYFEFFDDDVK